MTFKKIISPIMLILLVSMSLPAVANTGRIMTMSGDVKVNGQAMNKSYKVKGGDTVTTGASGKVNIVMSDKSVLDLQPNTKFKLERFSFNKTSPRRSRSIMNLLSGSFRYISGLVGRNNHDNATIKMGTATAGIRGSYATFGFDGEQTVNVEVSLGQMTMSFPDGSTATINKGTSFSSRTDGSGRRTAAASGRGHAILGKAEALIKNPGNAEALMQGLSDAEKAMLVAVIAANPTQLGASTDAVSAAIGAVVAVEPKSAPLVAAIVNVTAENDEVKSSTTTSIQEAAPGENLDAIDTTDAEAGDPDSTGTTITTTPPSSTSSGGGGTGSIVIP